MGVRGCGSVGVWGFSCTWVMGSMGVLVRVGEREKGLRTDERNSRAARETGMAQYEVYRLASAYHSCISRTIHVIPTVERIADAVVQVRLWASHSPGVQQ